MEELLKNIGITKPGEEKGGIYTISLNTYDEFSNVYNVLDKSTFVDKDSDNSTFNIDEAKIVFYNDEYDITLSGDLNDDVYVLTVQPTTEVKK